MSKVDDPTLSSVGPAKSFNHRLHSLSDGGVRSVQNAGVGVTLNNYWPLTNGLDRLRRVVKPVKADDVVAHIAGSIQGIPLALGEDDHGYLFQPKLFELYGKIFRNVGKEGLREVLERRWR